MKRWVSTSLTVVAVVGLVSYSWMNRTALAEVQLVAPVHLVTCAGALCVSLLAAGAVFQAMVNRFGPRLKLGESVALAVVTTGINTVVPFHAGAAFRAVYLKSQHRLELTAFAATFLGYNVLRLLVAAATALVSATWLACLDSAGKTAELAGLAATAGLCLAVSLMACLIPAGKAPESLLLRKAAAVGRGWNALRRPIGFLGRLTALVAAQNVAEVAALWAAWATIGVRLDLFAAAMIGSFALIASLTGLTPNGVGVYEVVVASVGTVVTVDPVRGLAAALVARAALGVVMVVTAPLAVLLLRRPASSMET